MSKPAATVSRTRPAISPPSRNFKRGERVRFMGAGKEWLGVVTEREMPDGQKSVHPRQDDTAIFVKFDETGISIPVSMHQLERVSDRRRG